MFKYETGSDIQSLIDYMMLAKEGKSIPKEDDTVFGLDTGSLYPDIIERYKRDGDNIDQVQEMLRALSNSHYGLIGQRPKARKYTFAKSDREKYESDIATVLNTSIVEDLRQQLAYLKQKWPV